VATAPHLTEVDIWERIIHPDRPMSKQTARRILELEFPEEDRAQMHVLVERNRHCDLDEEEEQFCRVGTMLSILKVRAHTPGAEMTNIVVDAALTQKLAGLSHPVQLCDEQGRVLGEFCPAVDRSLYQGVDSPLSPAELDRRERETGGYTTEELLQRLNKL
jgi:hypothetical protein